MDTPVHQVVIIGGGFAGLTAAQYLRKAPVQVTLLDRHNYHLFQPLLYQVATGGLSAANIASPLRSVLRKQKNARVLMAEAVDIDAEARRVVLADGELHYDTLIVATGVTHQYFGHDEWAEKAPGLKTIEDATEIRRRVLLAFEAAERQTDPELRKAWLTFVVVGGGPTGVELAGRLGELAHYTMRNNFRSIDPADARVILIEGTHRILQSFPENLSDKAERSLARLGVTTRRHVMVTDIQPHAVTIKIGGGEDRTETIACRTILWAAGVKASPLGKILEKSAGAELDHCGRVLVGPDCSLLGRPEIFVLGDLAVLNGPEGKPFPGVAPVAMQQGRYVAGLIRDRLRGRATEPFRYHDKGNLATIGRNAAVADLHWLRLWGYPAWVVWLLIHLLFIVAFENRVLILLQWFFTYLFRGRSARLITGPVPKLVENGPATPPDRPCALDV